MCLEKGFFGFRLMTTIMLNSLYCYEFYSFSSFVIISLFLLSKFKGYHLFYIYYRE